MLRGTSMRNCTCLRNLFQIAMLIGVTIIEPQINWVMLSKYDAEVTKLLLHRQKNSSPKAAI